MDGASGDAVGLVLGDDVTDGLPQSVGEQLSENLVVCVEERDRAPVRDAA